MKESKRLYVYLVHYVNGSASWEDVCLIVTDHVSKIQSILESTGMDSQDAYGNPKEPKIVINSVERIAFYGFDCEDQIFLFGKCYVDFRSLKFLNRT